MTATALNILEAIVEDYRHYIRFGESVMLRNIYGWEFSSKLKIGEKRYFGRVFYENCQRLGFKFIKKKNGVCTYERLQ